MFDFFYNRISFLEREIQILEHKIQDAPVGKLRVYTSGNYSRWIVLLPDGTNQYLKKAEKELAYRLWRKQQDMDTLNLYQKELAIMQRSDAVLKKLYNSQEKRINRHINTDAAREIAEFSKKSEWAKEPYSKNPYKPEGLTDIGPFSEKMRSKSEVIIAMSLVKYDIKYRYECEYPLNGRSVYPDFMIKRPSDGKIILWEHFGMWDVDKYRSAAIDKISEYLSSGLVPYEDFIYSIETSQRHTNPERINDMIRTFILK